MKRVVRYVKLTVSPVVTAACIISLFFSAAQAQNVLSIDDALGIALSRSYEVKTTKFSLEKSQMSLMSQQKQLKTQVDLSWNVPEWNKNIMANVQDDGSVKYFDNNSIATDARMEIRQPLLLTNGSFFIRGYYNTADEDNEVAEGIIRTTQTWIDGISINYRQPLFQPNSLKINLERTRRNLEITERGFEAKQNEIYYQVINKYYNLVRSKIDLEIQQENLQQNEQTYENTMNKYRAGIMAEVDALKSKVNLDEARVNFENSRLSFKRDLDAFKLYIGIPLDEDVDVENVVRDVQLVTVDENKAFEEAMANSAELRQIELNILDQQDVIEETKNERKFNANILLSYGISERDNLAFQPLKDVLFNDFSQTNRVSLNFNIPIFDWGAQKLNVERQYVELKSREERLSNSKLELRNQIQALIDRVNNNKSLMEIQAQSEEIAEKSYAITVERYDIGEIDIYSLYQENQSLKNTKLRVLNAKIDYLLAIAQLSQVTYWDFVRNQPLKDTITLFVGN